LPGFPPVKCIFKPSEVSYDSLTYIYILTDDHIPGEYIVEVFNVSDLAGNEINLQYNYAYYGGNAGLFLKIRVNSKELFSLFLLI